MQPACRIVLWAARKLGRSIYEPQRRRIAERGARERQIGVPDSVCPGVVASTEPHHPDRLALVALNRCEGLSRAAVCRLAGELGALRGRRPAGPAELGVPREALERARAAVAAAPRLAADELDRGATVVTLRDAGYPPALRELELPPPVLYVAGELPRAPAVAVVGSRAADAYGREAATLFGRELAAAGLTVVSGMARGVDTAAHRGALSAEGGRTVAVLGCGIDVDYPRGSGALKQSIAGSGAVVSEFPFGTPPWAGNFPIRNRIIAALAAGTLVVQGETRSGSLITARQALELGREVWAVPGRIFDSRSAGPNDLIRDGAQPVQRPRDVLESLPVAVRELLPAAAAEQPPAERLPAGDTGRLLAAMTPAEPLPPERLAAASGFGIERVLGLLLELELAGRVRREPGPAWCRRP